MTMVAVDRLAPVADASAPERRQAAAGGTRPGPGLLVAGAAVAIVCAAPLR
jgi:hypothetical protein